MTKSKVKSMSATVPNSDDEFGYLADGDDQELGNQVNSDDQDFNTSSYNNPNYVKSYEDISILNNRLTKRDIYMAKHSAEHMKQAVDKELLVLGVITAKIRRQNEPRILTTLITDKGSYYSSAVTMAESMIDFVDTFGDEILAEGCKIKIKLVSSGSGEEAKNFYSLVII